MNFKTIIWKKPILTLLDQTKLPNETIYQDIKDVEGTYQAIKTMIVRGAPAIGITAAYGMAIAALQSQAQTQEEFTNDLIKQGTYLKSARPTAVNLSWAIDRILTLIKRKQWISIATCQAAIEAEAMAIHQEDIAINKAIGTNLLSLIKPNSTILNHCNAGALATSEYGTSLSIFYLGKEQGLVYKAFIDETRPRQQGARLTAYELLNAGIDATLITDNMAAQVMSEGKIDAVIVGCDRVAANGDTANKIGTYSVAILAKHFNIPFYIATPTPTIDYQAPSGSSIPIEERDGKEITIINNKRVAPEGIKTYNPAFDVTPANLISAIVTEKGIAYPPFTKSLADFKK